jgi:hypothetical protein
MCGGEFHESRGRVDLRDPLPLSLPVSGDHHLHLIGAADWLEQAGGHTDGEPREIGRQLDGKPVASADWRRRRLVSDALRTAQRR